MMTFVPRGYGGFPSFQFSSPNQINNLYYNDGYRRRDAYFAPHYQARPFYQPPFNPTQSLYQPPFNPTRSMYQPPFNPTRSLYQPPFNPTTMYSSAGFDRAKQPSLGAQILMELEEFDEKYRYEQHLRKMEKMERKCSKLQRGVMPYSMYPPPVMPPLQPAPLMQPPAPHLPYNNGALFEYPRTTRYAPYPGVIDPRTGCYGPPLTATYGAGALPNYGMGGGMSLPPKIRVIFIPTGQSFSQQPCTGPLATPPFLYNRMSQPQCSFPLPPPLPQLQSLPLTPAVQQMVVQRYSNPLAVLPFTPNWQMPQMMMPGFPPGFQQQQQSMSAYQSFPSGHQLYNPAVMPAFSSLPSGSQPYMPSPAAAASSPPTFSSLPLAPNSYVPLSAPMSSFSSLPSATQPYPSPPLPPRPSMLSNSSMLPSSSLQSPVSYSNTVASSPQYADSNYPSLCRACPPAPPPLNMLVTGHCWVQHCAACHHVPSQDMSSNVRPTDGRSTPLLRYPIVPQYIPTQTQQQQQQQQQHQDPYGNTSVMTRPWLRKTPPLLPSTAGMSDGYYSTNGSGLQYDQLKNQYQCRSRNKYRSSSSTSRSTSTPSQIVPKSGKSTSPRRVKKSRRNHSQDQGSIPLKKPPSSTSPSTSSSGLSAEYQKTTIYATKNNQDDTSQQLAGEARNVNLQYNYQPQELPSVYNTNRYLKSSSECSTSSLSSRRRSSRKPSSAMKEYNSPSSDLCSITEEPTFHITAMKPPRPPSHSRKNKEKIIIIREFIPSSPSSVSTVSSDATFSIIDNDIDSTSTSSTIKADTTETDEDLHPKMF